MDKSKLLQNIRRNPLFAKFDDIVGMSKRAKSLNDKKLTQTTADKYYSEGDTICAECEHMCVAMFDGRVNTGGLCDRLWGAVSTWLYCKDNGIPFKLNFIEPFRLSDYLQSAKVDWVIDESKLSYDSRVARPLVIKCLGFGREDNMSPIGKAFCDNIKQVHVYTNAHGMRQRFHEGFSDLFAPSAVLAKSIDDVLKNHHDGYVSISFRFVRLFGDFDDINWPVLPSEESREKMIQRGLNAIERVKERHPGKDVLVTTDSITFLNRAKKLPGVFVVEGDIKHVDFSDVAEGALSHLKTFLDLMLISNAEHVYLGVNDQVYRSTFAKTASQIGNRPFEMIEF